MKEEGLILSLEKLLEAFDGDFREVYFDHQPTQEDIFAIKLNLVAQAQHVETKAHYEAEIRKLENEIRRMKAQPNKTVYAIGTDLNGNPLVKSRYIVEE